MEEKLIKSEFIRKSDVFGYRAFSGMEFSGVYAIVCIKTNKMYIGSTKNISRRVSKHFSELHLNRHTNKMLQNDYNTFGYENFKIVCLEQCNNEILIDRERYYQIFYGLNQIYNEKISHYWCSEEYSKSKAKSDKSSHKTEEYRTKMSLLRSHRIEQYLIKIDSDGNESFVSIKIYNTMKELLDSTSFKRSVICSACNGWKKKAYGFKWRYLDENGNQTFGRR